MNINIKYERLIEIETVSTIPLSICIFIFAQKYDNHGQSLHRLVKFFPKSRSPKTLNATRKRVDWYSTGPINQIP